MLSRVAERIYWAGRYLERAEDIARLIDEHSQLMLDLPRSAGISWRPVLEVIGLPVPARGPQASERELLKKLLVDETSPVAMTSIIGMARENFRTTRDIIPTEAWQGVNELYLFCRANLRWAVGQRRRHEILRDIVGRVQQIRGLLSDTMSHGMAYHFLRVGTFVERADMCTRIIDAAVASLLHNRERLLPYDNTLWMSTLKSVSGYQMYRQHVRRRVRAPDVLAFLLQDASFPRSVRHCLLQIERCMDDLPRGRPVVQKLREINETIPQLDVAALDEAALHAEVDRLQLALADLDQQMSEAWFLPRETSASR